MDPDLYEKAEQKADEIYAKSSAYKSGFIVKYYKKLGGRYRKSPLAKPLARWFKEKWQDVNPDKGVHTYPVYRPTVRMDEKTPKTADEITPKRLRAMARLKQKLRDKANLPPF